MSLRIASLPPDAPRASKDCRVCNRRRIRCDRSLPTCKKCGIRKLECPGYGLRIRWSSGVAIKSRPATKASPTLGSLSSASDAVEPVTIQSVTLVAQGNRSISNDSLDQARQNQTSIELYTSPTQKYFESGAISCQHAVDIHEAADEEVKVNRDFGIDLNLLFCPLPGALRNSSVRRLIHHYDHAVAATMAWVDGPDNAWRTTLLPLAMESPPLLLSILALAAEHLVAKMRLCGTNLVEDLGSSTKYRDRSLKLLSQQLRAEARTECSTLSLANRTPANSMLATMLVLCNLEMVQPVSSLWQVHLQAGRTMIQRWASFPLNKRHLSDPTSKFLLREFFILNAFASTTIFTDVGDGKGIPSTVLSEEDANSIFMDYLREIQEVTAEERRRTAPLQCGLPSPTCAVDIQVLQNKFQRARDRTISLGHQLDLGPEPAVRQDFNHLVEIYQHAGLIYSYQSLVAPAISGPYMAHSLTCLFSHLNNMPLAPSTRAAVFAQDILWPLFIAGTESRGRQDRQICVEQKLLNAMQSTGFSNCQQALLFLRQFWALDEVEAAGVTWIEYARERANKKNSSALLVF